ncbi:hypothetical protein KY290_021507 [Solanum tuberosum]|uniref:RNase H type-1 domain-containing protein n=1 Tax=Solanum tuberosum TaxID=4113 RepID=A0ABQ7V1S3_SOLTU|nr:hypothetical protein KY285_020423 [Solanum tuberosum]KAH0758014.1 hypothetical protein KY290_021507 [Solanum tuberosum]
MKGTRKQKLAVIDPVLKVIRTVVMSLDFKNIIANINPSSANHLNVQLKIISNETLASLTSEVNCEHGEMETMTHLLLTAPIAQRLWKQFASCAGLNIEGMHLQQIITTRWEHKASHKLTQILKAIPAIIMWALWKRRNTRRHGKDHSFNWMNHQCQETIHQLIRVKFPWLKKVPYQWMEIVDMLQRYKPTLHYHIVNWKLPEEGWIKCNTDGASKGNPGQSAYEFCMRNNNGDLVYAEGEDIGVATNMEAEAIALWKALQFCLGNGFQKVILETDSLSLKNMLIRNWRIPWEIAERVEDSQEIMKPINVQIRHTFREANQLADYIANIAIGTTEKQQFQEYNQLPSWGRSIVNIDKQQIPSLRIRTRKINNKNND